MRTLIFLVLLALIAAAGVGFMLYRQTNEPFRGYDAAEQFVEITPGSNTRTIGGGLVAKGVERSDATFRAALWRTGAARTLKAGTYPLDSPMKATARIAK